MSFVKRVIEVIITLGEGQFGDIPGNQITLTGHRVVVDVAVNGADSQGMMQARIYGLSLSIINKLTTIGPIMTQIRGANTIQINAGNEGEKLTAVFTGVITSSWGDFANPPDVTLNIIAYSGMGAALKPVNPSSYNGSTDVAVIMQNLADEAGYTFKNNSVHVVLSNQYLAGTTLDKIKTVANNAGINFDVTNNVLEIWGKYSARDGFIPTITPSSGLIGYPIFSSNGIVLRTEYMPSINWGSQIIVKDSQIPMANRQWTIFQVSHSLSAEMPGGPWFTQMGAWLGV